MRIALVHYWLLGSRGGERVLEAMARAFPEADIFTLFFDPEKAPAIFRTRDVRVSALNPLRRFHRSLLPLMPIALESFDLRSYDVVISSESGPAKGVITSAGTQHICYCHTPMRYLWELYPTYLHDFGGGSLRRLSMAVVSNYLRAWDVATSNRVDTFLANSCNVARRIWKTYRRSAEVVYPPVAVHDFGPNPSEEYFLLVSEMVAYKRLDYAIRLFARNGRKLKVVGDGPEYKALKRLAAPNVEFCGRVSDIEVRDLYSRAAAFLMPGEEDFGITMVEALASGKPVIGVGRGGALEIVEEGCGFLYPEATEASLDQALQRFDRERYSIDPARLIARAGTFSEAEFRRRFIDAVNGSLGRSQTCSQRVHQ